MAILSRRSAKNIRNGRFKRIGSVVAEAMWRAGSWVMAEIVTGLAAYGAVICYQSLALGGADPNEDVHERDVWSEEELVWPIDCFREAGIGATPVLPDTAYELAPLQISASTLRRSG
jgi:hypothetical protein